MEEIVPIWYILTGDRICLDDKEKALNPGDLFRDGGQTFQIADIEQNGEVIEIVYYTGTSTFVNSFFLSPDDTLDKIIN